MYIDPPPPPPPTHTYIYIIHYSVCVYIYMYLMLWNRSVNKISASNRPYLSILIFNRLQIHRQLLWLIFVNFPSSMPKLKPWEWPQFWILNYFPYFTHHRYPLLLFTIFFISFFNWVTAVEVIRRNAISLSHPKPPPTPRASNEATLQTRVRFMVGRSSSSLTWHQPVTTKIAL